MKERILSGSDIVAIISIIVAALSTGYNAWSATNSASEVERIKLSYEHKTTVLKNQFTERKDKCQAIMNTASNLAKAQAEYLKNYKSEARSEIDRYIWSGLTQITGENQKNLLQYYTKGPEQSDEYELYFTKGLTKRTLVSLAQEAILCASK